MTSYREALRTIFERSDFERGDRAPYATRTWRLGRVSELLEQLGDPQRRYRSAHIAGTKGKGSTTAMVDAILRAAGYRSGMYTSPHLHTFRERIRVDGEPISEDEVVALVERLRPLLATRPEVTVFEIITAMAMKRFAERRVDWGVFEVGLGGRLDATNVLHPEITAITSISHDHMGVLGNSLSEIAREKAGIIKPGTPLISAPQRPEVQRVIEATCREQGAPLFQVGRDWTWQRLSVDACGQRFSVARRGERTPRFPELLLPLLGPHQLENATVAVAMIETLRRRGLELPDAAIRDGLAQVNWPGRLEILGRRPLVVVDGAHNPYALQKVLGSLAEALPYRRLRVIFGASRVHLPDRMLTTLRGFATRILLTRAHHPKSAPLEELSATAEALGFAWSTHATVREALEAGIAEADAEDLVLVSGSLFVTAEAREAWQAINGLPPLPSDPPGAY